MSVSCDCCVLSGTCLCDEPIPRLEESYRVCVCVCVCVCERVSVCACVCPFSGIRCSKTPSTLTMIQ